MKNSKTLIVAAASISIAASGAAFAAKAPVAALDLAVATTTAQFDLSNAVLSPEVTTGEATVQQVRLSRAERRAQRQARRAERRAARRAARQDNAGSVNAPFGFLADGVTPRTQPATRSDIRLRENGGELRAADSFFNENRRWCERSDVLTSERKTGLVALAAEPSASKSPRFWGSWSTC